LAGLVALPKPKTIGVYRQSNNTFYLSSTNFSGATVQVVQFGTGSTLYPIVGNWEPIALDAQYVIYDHLGTYDQHSGAFALCGHNGSNLTDGICANSYANQIVYNFVFGNPGDYPLAGRWNLHEPAGFYGGYPPVSTLVHWPPDGIGIFRPTNGIIYLKKQPGTGFSDYSMILGNPGDEGIAGDWNGDGISSPGIYRPSSAKFYLSNQVTNGIVYSDISFVYGNVGTSNVALAGNWVGVGNPNLGVGVYVNGNFQLRNTLSTGFSDENVTFGGVGDIPIVGQWGYAYFFAPPPQGSPQPNRMSPALLVSMTSAPTQPPGSNSVPGGNQIGS